MSSTPSQCSSRSNSASCDKSDSDSTEEEEDVPPLHASVRDGMYPLFFIHAVPEATEAALAAGTSCTQLKSRRVPLELEFIGTCFAVGPKVVVTTAHHYDTRNDDVGRFGVLVECPKATEEMLRRQQTLERDEAFAARENYRVRRRLEASASNKGKAKKKPLAAAVASSSGGVLAPPPAELPPVAMFANEKAFVLVPCRYGAKAPTNMDWEEGGTAAARADAAKAVATSLTSSTSTPSSLAWRPEGSKEGDSAEPPSAPKVSPDMAVFWLESPLPHYVAAPEGLAAASPTEGAAVTTAYFDPPSVRFAVNAVATHVRSELAASHAEATSEDGENAGAVVVGATRVLSGLTLAHQLPKAKGTSSEQDPPATDSDAEEQLRPNPLANTPFTLFGRPYVREPTSAINNAAKSVPLPPPVSECLLLARPRLPPTSKGGKRGAGPIIGAASSGAAVAVMRAIVLVSRSRPIPPIARSSATVIGGIACEGYFREAQRVYERARRIVASTPPEKAPPGPIEGSQTREEAEVEDAKKKASSLQPTPAAGASANEKRSSLGKKQYDARRIVISIDDGDSDGDEDADSARQTNSGRDRVVPAAMRPPAGAFSPAHAFNQASSYVTNAHVRAPSGFSGPSGQRTSLFVDDDEEDNGAAGGNRWYRCGEAPVAARSAAVDASRGWFSPVGGCFGRLSDRFDRVIPAAPLRAPSSANPFLSPSGGQKRAREEDSEGEDGTSASASLSLDGAEAQGIVDATSGGRVLTQQEAAEAIELAAGDEGVEVVVESDEATTAITAAAALALPPPPTHHPFPLPLTMAASPLTHRRGGPSTPFGSSGGVVVDGVAGTRIVGMHVATNNMFAFYRYYRPKQERILRALAAKAMCGAAATADEEASPSFDPAAVVKCESDDSTSAAGAVSDKGSPSSETCESPEGDSEELRVRAAAAALLSAPTIPSVPPKGAEDTRIGEFLTSRAIVRALGEMQVYLNPLE